MLVIEKTPGRGLTTKSGGSVLEIGKDRGRMASKPPAGAKSAIETRRCIRRGNGPERESVVKIEKKHRH
jgi:hypothetical protein